MGVLLSDEKIEAVFDEAYSKAWDGELNGISKAERAGRKEVAMEQLRVCIAAIQENFTDKRQGLTLSSLSEPDIHGPMALRQLAVRILEDEGSVEVFTKADVELNRKEERRACIKDLQTTLDGFYSACSAPGPDEEMQMQRSYDQGYMKALSDAIDLLEKARK